MSSSASRSPVDEYDGVVQEKAQTLNNLWGCDTDVGGLINEIRGSDDNPRVIGTLDALINWAEQTQGQWQEVKPCLEDLADALLELDTDWTAAGVQVAQKKWDDRHPLPPRPETNEERAAESDDMPQQNVCTVASLPVTVNHADNGPQNNPPAAQARGKPLAFHKDFRNASPDKDADEDDDEDDDDKKSVYVDDEADLHLLRAENLPDYEDQGNAVYLPGGAGGPGQTALASSTTIPFQYPVNEDEEESVTPEDAGLASSSEHPPEDPYEEFQVDGDDVGSEEGEVVEDDEDSIADTEPVFCYGDGDEPLQLGVSQEGNYYPTLPESPPRPPSPIPSSSSSSSPLTSSAQDALGYQIIGHNRAMARSGYSPTYVAYAQDVDRVVGADQHAPTLGQDLGQVYGAASGEHDPARGAGYESAERTAAFEQGLEQLDQASRTEYNPSRLTRSEIEEELYLRAMEQSRLNRLLENTSIAEDPNTPAVDERIEDPRQDDVPATNLDGLAGGPELVNEALASLQAQMNQPTPQQGARRNRNGGRANPEGLSAEAVAEARGRAMVLAQQRRPQQQQVSQRPDSVRTAASRPGLVSGTSSRAGQTHLRRILAPSSRKVPGQSPQITSSGQPSPAGSGFTAINAATIQPQGSRQFEGPRQPEASRQRPTPGLGQPSGSAQNSGPHRTPGQTQGSHQPQGFQQRQGSQQPAGPLGNLPPPPRQSLPPGSRQRQAPPPPRTRPTIPAYWQDATRETYDDLSYRVAVRPSDPQADIHRLRRERARAKLQHDLEIKAKELRASGAQLRGQGSEFRGQGSELRARYVEQQAEVLDMTRKRNAMTFEDEDEDEVDWS